MRRVIGAAIFAIALVFVGSAAFATAAAGPQFGVYTANVGVAGDGHLEVSIHVLQPPTKVALTFSCGKPTGADTVTEVWNSPPVPLHGGAFSFHRTGSLTRFTTVTENNALLKRSSYNGNVNAQGSFTARGQFVGTLGIAGSPCSRTQYTALRLAGPTP